MHYIIELKNGSSKPERVELYKVAYFCGFRRLRRDRTFVVLKPRPWVEANANLLLQKVSDLRVTECVRREDEK